MLFYLLCIPCRLALAYLSTLVPYKYRFLPAAAAIVLSVTWLYMYFTDTRMYAAEAKGPTWWHMLRPLHAMFYALFAVYTLKGEQQYALYVLLSDVFVGLFFQLLLSPNSMIVTQVD